jgi:outer membrane lipoprotein-sorting protein
MDCLRARRDLALIFAVATLSSTSCLVRTRTVAPPGKTANRPLLKATKDELIQRIHSVSDPIRSFTMKIDMAPSIGNLYGGKVTDYPEISGYILYRKPDEIRVIGLDPVVHSTAFDMLSKGNEFRVLIPSRNQFIEGLNDAPANSPNKLENLRPVAFLTSLLINPPVGDADPTILEDDTNETKAIYIMMFLSRDGEQLRLLRNVYFNRYTLQIIRQKTFDAGGYIVSDTTYSNWKDYGGIPFPATIDIQRPQDGYELVLTVTDLKVNSPDITDQKFVLEKPPNAQVKVLK